MEQKKRSLQQPLIHLRNYPHVRCCHEVVRAGCASRTWQVASFESVDDASFVGNTPHDGLAITSRHAYIVGHDDAHRTNRLFSRREAQGTKLVEVGDLSCRKTKPGRAVVDLFSDHDDGQ
jgi:hypothetical protein